MAKLLLTTDEPITNGDQLKHVAVEDVLAYEAWLQAKGVASKLTNGEKHNLMDYIYFKWQQNQG